MDRFRHITFRNYVGVGWLVALAAILGLYFLKPDFLHNQFAFVAGLPPFWQYLLFFLAGCVRGLTLIPSTYLIIAGLLIFTPWPLFIIILTGILVSSASVYFFSGFLRLDTFFEQRYQKRIRQVKVVLQKHELPIIIGWSFFPFLPTDMICYVCGALNIEFKKFMLGVFIGEGITCALYIFGGSALLRFLNVL